MLPENMTYDQFLEMFGKEGYDTDQARNAYQEIFGERPGALYNLGLSPPTHGVPKGIPYAHPGDVNPFYSSSDPIAAGGHVPHVTEHYTVAPPNRPDNTWDIRPGLSRPSVNTVTGEEGRWTLGSGASHGGPGSHEGAVQMYNDSLDTSPASSVASAPYATGLPDLNQTVQASPNFNPEFASTFPGRMSQTDLASSYPAPVSVPTGPSGLLSVDAASGTSLPYSGEGVSESLAAETAAADSASGLSGPQAFAANMALNFIPTRDREKVDTPIGDKGSKSGILKGAGKGALTGYTLSGGNPYGALAGGVLGAYGGTQGYFDSTTPPSIQIARIKRGGGSRMPQGLLGGGMYA